MQYCICRLLDLSVLEPILIYLNHIYLDLIPLLSAMDCLYDVL